MKEFKATPGPWSIDEFDTVVHGEEPSHGWERKETVRVSGVALPSRVTEEYAANTRLVAASPCLLSAIQHLVEVYDSDDGKQWTTTSKKEAIAEARAAIDKALGE